MKRRPELLALILLCGSLAIAWSILVPKFEAPDEKAHLRYVMYVAQAGRLPSELWPGSPAWDFYLYEAHQPPLFYYGAAALLRVMGAPLVDPSPPARNPEFGKGPPNEYLHAPAGNLPGDSTGWFLGIRLLSASFGLATVILSYFMADIVFGGRRAHSLVAAALVGLSPQFLFISSSISNDSLVALTSTGALFATVHLLRVEKVRWWIPSLLGGVTGVALLAKLSALALLPAIAAATLWRCLRPGGRVSHLLAFAVLLVISTGWYFARNLALWQDPLLSRFAEQATPNLIDRKSLWSDYWLSEFFRRTLFRSFWGAFGHVNLFFPDSAYRVVAAFTGLGMVGIIVKAVSHLLARTEDLATARRTPYLSFLGLAVAVNSAALVFYNLSFTQAQGRFLFPSIAAIAILLTAGWSALLAPLASYLSRATHIGRALPAVSAGLVVAAMAGWNLWALRLVHNAYWLA